MQCESYNFYYFLMNEYNLLNIYLLFTFFKHTFDIMKKLYIVCIKL